MEPVALPSYRKGSLRQGGSGSHVSSVAGTRLLQGMGTSCALKQVSTKKNTWRKSINFSFLPSKNTNRTNFRECLFGFRLQLSIQKQ